MNHCRIPTATLCRLHKSVLYNSFTYGIEYENPIGGNGDDDATCAVCYVSTRETQLMLPAKTSCPESWTREYYGYLMSGTIGNSGHSSFVCVDRAYELVPGSQGHRNSGHLHHVEAVCGTMQCPP